MKLIGITGKAGAGKDTAAAAMVDHGYQIVSFADPIKEAINTMMGWNMSQWSNREWKETPQPPLGVSPRFLATTLGTEWGRQIVDSDMWVKLAIDRAGSYPTIIPDVRFDNEAKMIKNAGGIVIEIVRPNNPYPAVNHSSENGVSPEYVDHQIVNDGDVGDLIFRVDNLLRGL